MISTHIESIGIELECGIPGDSDDANLFERELSACFGDHFTSSGDGSVNVPHCCDRELKFWDANLLEVSRFLHACYPTIKTNTSCGFHVHVRFKDRSLAKLFSFNQSYQLFIDLYKEHAESLPRRTSTYLKRLTNHYCDGCYIKGDILEQLSAHGKCNERYHAINLNSMNIHGTLEFRVLPHQLSASEAMGSINWLVATIERVIESYTSHVEVITLDEPVFSPLPAYVEVIVPEVV